MPSKPLVGGSGVELGGKGALDGETEDVMGRETPVSPVYSRYPARDMRCRNPSTGIPRNNRIALSVRGYDVEHRRARHSQFDFDRRR
jgi:hypothetical protein